MVDLAKGLAQADVAAVQEDVDVVFADLSFENVQVAADADEDAHGRAFGRVERVGAQVEHAVVDEPVKVNGPEVGGDHPNLGAVGQRGQPGKGRQRQHGR